jgi:hypothetical protein
MRGDRLLDLWLERNPLPEDIEERHKLVATMPKDVSHLWRLRQAKLAMESPGFNADVVRRAKSRMIWLDSLRPEYRDLVNDYGQRWVNHFMSMGYSDPRQLRDALEDLRTRSDEHMIATGKR